MPSNTVAAPPHGLALARGMSPRAAMAELYGKRTGLCNAVDKRKRIIRTLRQRYFNNSSKPCGPLTLTNPQEENFICN